MTVDVIARESPLHRFAERLAAAGRAELTVREVPFLAQVNLRLDAADVRAVTAVTKSLGVRPPVEPNTVAQRDGRRILWLGPDEWLFVAADSDGEAIASELRSEVDSHGGSVVDVSANRTTIEIAGAETCDLLTAGCALDLHPRVFGPGRCAQTLVAKAGVILHQLDERPTFHVLVRPSLAGYLAEWLLDAALTVPPPTRS